MVSRINSISAAICALRISCGVSGRAGSRSTGSPTSTIFSNMSPVVYRRGERRTTVSGLLRRPADTTRICSRAKATVSGAVAGLAGKPLRGFPDEPC
jgi:hypothetical protein